MKKVIQTIMDIVCKTNGLMSKFCRILLLVIVSGKMAHNVSGIGDVAAIGVPSAQIPTEDKLKN